MASLLRETSFLRAAVTDSGSVLKDVDVETNLLLGAVRTEESAVGDSDLELSALELFVQIVFIICHLVVLHHHLVVALLIMHQKELHKREHIVKEKGYIVGSSLNLFHDKMLQLYNRTQSYS